MFEFLSALRWLTILPVSGGDSEARPASWLLWLPAVGVMLGVMVLLAAWLGLLAAPMLAGLLALLAWHGVTGGRQLLALANVVRNRFSEETLQGHDLGVIAIVIALLCKWVVLTLIAEQGEWMALVLVPLWSYLGALWWLNHVEAEEGSVLADCMQASDGLLEKYLPWVFGLWVLGFVLADGVWLAPLALWAVLWLMHRAHAMMNTSVLGAGIEISELLMLVAVCIMMG